ncbi:adenylate cyclase [Oxalobacteraceae bacterium GrIS 2.11]
MALEIERKFLVHGTPWQSLPQGALMRQGYLLASPQRVVRVRIEGDAAMLTIKGGGQGIVRGEWEYPIPVKDAHELLQLCEQPLIEKYRYRILHEGMLWELDVFTGDNAGLVVAEIELDSESQTFSKPDWVAEEVTQDPRYLNANLMRHPYSKW